MLHNVIGGLQGIVDHGHGGALRGMMVFFLLGGALRSAGDARTPLRYGVALTVLNLVNVILIRGFGPIPARL